MELQVESELESSTNILYTNIIVIPYRNRQKQLDYFIHHSVPLIKQFLPNTKVIVIEQAEGKPFNRGKLLNVVFTEFKNRTKYFITNDVDLNPTRQTIQTYYAMDIETENKVVGILTSPHNTLGGIIKIRSDTIHTLNGFPNTIWGWGAEDKALQNRATYHGLVKQSIFLHTCKTRNDENFITFDDVEDRDRHNYSKHFKNEYRVFDTLTKEEQYKVIMDSGLNTMEYTILERNPIEDNVERIRVEL